MALAVREDADGRAPGGGSGEACNGVPDEEHDLEELRAAWSGVYGIGCADGQWHAARWDGTGPELTRASAPGLDFALRISQGGA